jgi:hypothetical protein
MNSQDSNLSSENYSNYEDSNMSFPVTASTQGSNADDTNDANPDMRLGRWSPSVFVIILKWFWKIEIALECVGACICHVTGNRPYPALFIRGSGALKIQLINSFNHQ